MNNNFTDKHPHDSKNTVSLGERLKALRKNRNMSVTDLSRKTGIGVRTIYKYEKGEQIPHMEDLKEYSKKFHVTLNYLFYGTDETCDDDKNRIEDLSDESQKIVQSVIQLIAKLEMPL